MNVDPLLSLLVGALGAALLGLLGATIQGRREHAKWIRERRHEAYNAFMRAADRVRNADADPHVRETLERLSSSRRALVELMRKELGMKG